MSLTSSFSLAGAIDGSLLLAIAATFSFSLAIVVIAMPGLLRKMRDGGMVGNDVNKPSRLEVPELGGIAALFAFSISLTIIVGVRKMVGDIAELPYLAVISVFFIAAMVGLIDDISNIPQRLKVVGVAFAALPLMLVHLGAEVSLPFDYMVALVGSTYFLYWLALVPAGVSGVANAMNMSAGYNGLESGQILIISSAMLAVLLIDGGPDYAVIVSGALVGAAVGLYAFNRYPARVFVGDIGTLGLGAALAGAIILGHIEIYGLIAILPAFYEGFATAYYSLFRKVPDRRYACHHPVIGPDGKLRPPDGAGRYTLAYRLLSRKPMTERQLVRTLLALYGFAGAAAVALSVIG
jgi:UDP-N-acetylglucosamine--dolichyl-phosphate N-acetylglucosaminephosphotransferase